eukprot:GHVN01043088.1.p1 GENE.GHVN01043088.1~~GHVN01043088.1.p1  ORF type:complete len:104 (-),score=15.77 GHVN01043088.1:99-410(-)
MRFILLIFALFYIFAQAEKANIGCPTCSRRRRPLPVSYVETSVAAHSQVGDQGEPSYGEREKAQQRRRSSGRSKHAHSLARGSRRFKGAESDIMRGVGRMTDQ